MKVKFLAGVLTACLLAGMTAGCGSGTTTTKSKSTAATASKAAQASAAEATVAEATAEPSASASADLSVTLPISTTPESYSMWFVVPPNCADYVNDPGTDISIFKLLADKTNISFDFTVASLDSATEKFQLMAASDSMTDVVNDGMSYYTGSIDDAVNNDEIFLDYSKYLNDGTMPNYSKVLSDYPSVKQAITSADTGSMAGFPCIYKEAGLDASGYMVRRDYLTDLDMETPETYDELHDLLKAIQEKYGATMELTNSGGDGMLGAGFGINADLSDTSLKGWMLDEDGRVQLSILQDSFKDYIQLVHDWYAEGLIYSDFINSDRGMLDQVFSGDVAVTVKAPEVMSVAQAVAGIDLVPFSLPKQTEDQTLHVDGSPASNIMDAAAWSISATCENPEDLLKLIDYMYSDDANLMMNYGEEGVTYTLDSNGEPQWSDVITNSDKGYDFAITTYLYATGGRSRLPFVVDYRKNFYGYTDLQLSAIDIFQKQCDNTQDYPSGCNMNTAETESYNTVASDINTYISEHVLKFIYGTEDMSGWDSFVDTIKTMGVNTAIAAKQEAYDNYMAAMSA